MLAAINLVTGLFMVVDPAGFVDSIGPFGEVNDHYVRDVASWTLAYAAVLFVAAGNASWRVPVLGFGIAQSALHIVNHLVDIGDADPGWVGWFDAVALTRAARRDGLAAVGSARPGRPGAGAMRVFVAGASGVIGRPLIDRLLAGGHEVVALARSEDKAAALRERGVEPVIADALDAPALRAAVLAPRPEVVINQLTALPRRIDPRKYATALAPTNRLRREAGPVLAAAAAEAGARRVVSQSVCFMLEPAGRLGPGRGGAALPRPAGRDARRRRGDEDAGASDAGDAGHRGRRAALRVLLRPRAPRTRPTDRWRDDIRKRRMPVVGSGEGRFSFIHVDDAADATVLALDHGSPGIYNITDDEPATQREWVTELARVSARRGRCGCRSGSAGSRPARWHSGGQPARRLERQGAARARLAPAHPDWRAGFAEVFGGS